MTASEALQYMNGGGRVKAESATDEFYHLTQHDLVSELKQVTPVAAKVIRQISPTQFESEGFGITFEIYE